MTATDDLVQRNAQREAAEGGLPGPPSLHVAIVTCMDCRIDLGRSLGIRDGEAHVLRNAGGAVTDDVIRSLAVSQRSLGTREILLVHHTKCGMQTMTDDEFKASVQEETGVRPQWAVEAFTDAEQDVRQSMERIRRSPFLDLTTSLRGFVVDIDTGELAEVG